MKKVLKWLGIGFVGLVILGAIVGNDNKKTTSASSATVAKPTVPEDTSVPVKSTTTAEAAVEPEPISVSVDGPSVTFEDTIKLHGTVSVPGAKVRVDGHRAAVHGTRWWKTVPIKRRGDNTYEVLATKHGFVKDNYDASVTRKMTAAEKAVIRQQKADRRANSRALESAEGYLAMSGMSKKGLYEQLSSSAGEGFTSAQAQYAVDHVHANWKQEAVQSAKEYLDMQPMSRNDLIEQLSSDAGEGFTAEQALYAVNKVY
jgi:hypothetical protein